MQVNTIITPPTDKKLIELETATLWFDESGILYSISKKTKLQTLADTRRNMAIFKELIGDRKVCLLADITNSSESSKDAREYAAVELPLFIKAAAMISNASFSNMMSNLFFIIKAQSYPTRMFNDETRAKEWLKKQL